MSVGKDYKYCVRKCTCDEPKIATWIVVTAVFLSFVGLWTLMGAIEMSIMGSIAPDR
jgi:hypothetical protein